MSDANQNGITGSESHPIPEKSRARRIPYPGIEKHGIIGDRRTAALVAADGTLDWMCLPHFDSAIIFGALLDWAIGGHWRLGPGLMAEGAQSYLPESMVLQTEWNMDAGTAVLSDTMLWPENSRPPEQRDSRVVVRRLCCTRGSVACVFDFEPRHEFSEILPTIDEYSSGFTITLGDLSLRLWTSHSLESENGRIHGDFNLSEGEELWAVLELGAAGQSWTVDSARAAFDASRQYWQGWLKNLDHAGYGDTEIRRAAMAVHLLTYAPEGSVVAAATTSLPERIGGEWNADYRLCWVRDASLSVGMLARLGILEETEQYLQWLAGRRSRFGQPLQVLYGVRGEKRKKQHKLDGAAGYRNSSPVRAGNHAYKQHQLGSYGYLADCVWIYVQAGGKWREEYWDLIQKLAHYTIKHWQDPENGIWELPEAQHFVNSKVLCWVMLDRAVKIAGKVNTSFDTSEWRAEAEKIHSDVMDRGWSERLQSFRQRYDAENLDAAGLLIPVLEFLPGNHPRVLATIQRTVQDLTIDGFVYRFDPLVTPGLGDLPMGQLEGAFLPCTFWLATAYAKSGKIREAKGILERAEKIAGPLGLFSEAVDPRTHGFLGNTPLLFSHVEYVRAKKEIARVEGERP